MSKINDLVNTLKSGARANKYRIIIPSVDISRSLDVMCHSASLPGRIITPVDVVIKGKKTQIVGETSLSGSWTANFYNDSGMVSRKYFTRWMEELHNLNIKDNSGLLGGLGELGNTISQGINAADSIGQAVKEVKAIVNDPLQLLVRTHAPEYQKDIKVQQLDGNNNVIFEATITGAFPINVEDISLDDSTAEISSTSVTFAFSDIVIGDSSVKRQALQSILGDNLGGLIS